MSDEINEEPETKSKELKAKKVSLAGKIVGGSIILIGFILKCLKVFECETNDLIKVGIAIMAVFAPIDFNISLDKFLNKE